MPNSQYTRAPRQRTSSQKKSHVFNAKQLRAAYRRIAGIFNDSEREIYPRYRNADVHGAVRNLVVQRAHPIQGLEREDVHKSLFSQAFDRLVEDGKISIDGDHAVMDAMFAQKQKGISDRLRDEAKKKHAPKTKHRDNGRRGSNEKKRYNRPLEKRTAV